MAANLQSASRRSVLAVFDFDGTLTRGDTLPLYVEPWAFAAGFHDVVSTALDYDASGRATGRLAGGNCRGAEKLRRLEALHGELRGRAVYGYGDSADDQPFLERCLERHY